MRTRLLEALGWGLAAALGVAAFLLILTLARDAALPVKNKYGLVFDAGSTHTALYVYRWPADKENGTGIVSQVEACTVAGPGISSYADNPAGAGASLKPCLDKALELIPAEQQRDTPVYLGATAGMRLLREQNSSEAQQIFAEIARAIGEYPLAFHGAQILTGNEEGSFGWITVNYLLQTLVKFSFAERWEHPQDTEVWGALDLGGASTQITFQPGAAVEDENSSVSLRLYGSEYGLYTHSYLCYGQLQALRMLLAALLQGSPAGQRISHPCYPRGYQENVSTAELYGGPCVPAPGAPGAAQNLTVTGTGDPAACRAAVQRLFNLSCGASGSCGFNGVYQPPVRGQFFAFSGFYHNLHFLNLTRGQSLSSVNATIERFCNSSWDELQEEFPTMNKTHLRDACAANSYTLTLLLQGYRFNHTTWLNIHFVRQVSDVDVGWTLGYMLNLTNMIPSETPQRVVGLQRSSWVAATVLLAVMLILIFFQLTVTCCQRNSGYESL
ncbi:ectonucleoside triphosphate diphosphohydrolase 8-like [Colius striatus]|uniref:ectonucleoside triphosphate diphosphohydrolase 8-like n=1 Tax=Colius striatus TaxID=57412 RepID=UPI002B1D1C1D|nr:ectonucleoside triphosphate diphosphohydrolase 8-like [Colius striatus]XP_061867501.1 ectonucleoside triphosphate diphosphohydrolase 8-like [Colius striatus]